MANHISFLPAHPHVVAHPRPTVAERGVSVLQAVGRWVALVSSRRHLRDMDDHMLQDVGISRAQAHFEASRKPWDIANHG